MEIRPIFSALMRNKTGLVLIALQVAITLAIVTNSLFIIKERVEAMNRPSGIDEAGLFTVSSLPFAPGFDRAGSIAQDMQTLRAMPGVIDATPINNLPLSGGGWGEGMATKPIDPNTAKPEDSKGTTIYMVDDHGVNTMGVNIVEGRNFNADEITDRKDGDNGWPEQLIITKALAKELFPDESAIGKRVFMSADARGSVVVGVLERLQAPWVSWDGVERATLIPQRDLGGETRYLVRVQAGERDQMMKTVEAKLAEINTGRIVRGLRDYSEIRQRAYSRDHAMTVILISVIIGLLLITGLGIIGMASFWVTQRVKQIGTRRALGARKFDILRYFQLENFIITSIGLAFGVALSYGFNIWLMQVFDAERLAWYYVPVGALCVWVLGQLAVVGPATRAARVSPSVATRSV